MNIYLIPAKAHSQHQFKWYHDFYQLLKQLNPTLCRLDRADILWLTNCRHRFTRDLAKITCHKREVQACKGINTPPNDASKCVEACLISEGKSTSWSSLFCGDIGLMTTISDQHLEQDLAFVFESECNPNPCLFCSKLYIYMICMPISGSHYNLLILL